MSKSVTSMFSKSGTALASYTLVGEYTQTTAPCNPRINPSCPPAQTVRNVGPMQKAIGYAALALAYSCAPADALAQWGMNFADCFGEWMLYGAAVASLYASAGLTLDGVGLATIGAAYGAAVWAMKALVDCMVAHDRTASSGFGGGGAAGAGTGGGGNDPTCDSGGAGCLEAYVL